MVVVKKKCSCCNKLKSISNFGKDSRTLDGLKYHCKECRNEYERKWRKQNPRKLMERKRRYYEKNRDKINEYNRKHRRKRPDHYRKIHKKYREKLRLQILTHYGGNPPKCQCCGEAHIEFLTIDHIKGGGNKHRKRISGTIFTWLKKNNFPEGFQVLCWNCNCAKAFYGYCPHNKS